MASSFFFFKQKPAYEIPKRDWSSDVCSSDLGGTVPGSGSGQAREIFQEGLHLPPVKFAARYKPVEEIAAMITANSRTPGLVIGDIRVQIGACRLGETRLAELMERYGKETIVDATEQLS